MNKKIPRNVLIVSFVALVSGFGQDIITPVLPAYLTLLGFSAAGIGLIDGLLQGATSVFRFISGILSDRYRNRKFFVFLGYGLSAIARPLLAITSSFAPITTLRTLDGIGKGMKDAPRDALIADSSDGKIQGRVFGFQRLVDTVGSILGPLVAGLLLLLLLPTLGTYRLIFALSAIPGLIAISLIWFGIRERRKLISQENKKSQLRLPISFWVFSGTIAMAMMTKVNDSLFLLRVHDIGLSQTMIPFLFAGFTLIYAFLSYPVGIWSDRWGKLPFIAAGWLILSVVELVYSFGPNVVVAVVIFAFYGIFYALTEGSARAYIADTIPLELRGRAYAIFHTLVGVSVIIGGFGIGQVWETASPALAFKIAAVGSFASSLIFIILAQRSKKFKSNTQ